LTAGRTNLGDDGVRALGRSPDGDGGDATAMAAGVGAPALVGGASMHRRRPPVGACEPVLIRRPAPRGRQARRNWTPTNGPVY